MMQRSDTNVPVSVAVNVKPFISHTSCYRQL